MKRLMIIGPIAALTFSGCGSSTDPKSKTLVLNLRKGHYAVISNSPGHYVAGMHRDLPAS
jgi:hypothetical protein